MLGWTSLAIWIRSNSSCLVIDLNLYDSRSLWPGNLGQVNVVQIRFVYFMLDLSGYALFHWSGYMADTDQTCWFTFARSTRKGFCSVSGSCV